MSETLKKLLTVSASALMLASVGTSASGNFATANASHIRSHRTVKRDNSLNPRYYYRNYYHLTKRNRSNKSYMRGYRDNLNRAMLNTKLARHSASYRKGWIIADTPDLKMNHNPIRSINSIRESIVQLQSGIRYGKNNKRTSIWMTPNKRGTSLKWTKRNIDLNHWSKYFNAPETLVHTKHGSYYTLIDRTLDPQTYTRHSEVKAINGADYYNPAYRSGLLSGVRQIVNIKQAKEFSNYRIGWIVGATTGLMTSHNVAHGDLSAMKPSRVKAVINKFQSSTKYGEKNHRKTIYVSAKKNNKHVRTSVKK